MKILLALAAAATLAGSFVAPANASVYAYHGAHYNYRWHGGYYNYRWHGGYYNHRYCHYHGCRYY